MKLFRDFLSRHRSNKKKSPSSSLNIKSTNTIQSTNESAISSSCDQTLTLFDKQTKCTCHYFVNSLFSNNINYEDKKHLNENNLTNNLHTKLMSIHSTFTPRLSRNIIHSFECFSDVQYIFTVADFCFWYDVRSTLLDVIDRVIAMNEQRPSTIIKFCLPQSNTIHRKILRRPKTSIAIQTSSDYRQQRNAKVQTNTVTLFPLSKPHIFSLN